MKTKIVLATTLSALLVGCGSGGSSANKEESSQKNPLSNVTVVDSYVIGATVCDSDGICAQTDSYGVATAHFNREGILTSKGGFIDANLNHLIDADEIHAPDMTLESNASAIITPLTDLIAHGADENQLATLLNIPVEALYQDPIKTDNIDLAKAIQIASTLLSKNDSKERFIEKINSYTPTQKSDSALPDFGSTTQVTGINLFANYALTSADTTTSQNFIINIQKSDASDVKTFMKNTEEFKIDANTPVKVEVSHETNSSISTAVPADETVDTTTDATTDTVIDPTTETTTTTTDTPVAVTGESDLPDFGESGTTSESTTSTVTTTTEDSALPDFDSNKTDGFTDSTTTTYTPPTPTVVAPQYSAKFFNKNIALKKNSDTSFQFEKEAQYNLATQDFNITTLFDFNATKLFETTQYTSLASGHHDGEVLFHLQDRDTKADVNLTAHNVDYFIDTNKKLRKITLRNGKTIDLNATKTADSASMNLTTDYTFDNYAINIPKALNTTLKTKLNDLNNSFIASDHNYTMSIIYNISGSQKEIDGDFQVIQATPPSFTLLPTLPDDILLERTSLNKKIATATSHPLKCTIEGVAGLSCSVDVNNDLNITGRPTDVIGSYFPTITLTNEKYNLEYKKQLHISLVDKADNKLVSNWNLVNDGNITTAKIAISPESGDWSHDAISLYTSLTTPPTGAPESNQTIFIEDATTHNQLEFTFDNSAYSNNDLFKIVTDHNKSVTFKIGDFDASNNSVYLK